MARKRRPPDLLGWSGRLLAAGKLDVAFTAPAPSFRETRLPGRLSAPFMNGSCRRAWEKTPVKWMTYVDLNLRLPELLLMRLDKMGMGASLETRVPFLDHKFVELAMSIPEQVITGRK